MTIRVYPSVLPGEPIEIHESDGVTIEQWLIDTVPEYEPRSEPPISIAVNGKLVEPERWAGTVLRDDDDVEIRPQPKGGGLIIGAIVAAVVAVAATVLLKPSLPSQKSRSKSSQGSEIYEASAEGNVARPSEVIPELAGRHKRFPDYLTQARRRFSGPKEQQLDMLLCLGRGSFDVEPNSIMLGNTPFNELLGSVDYQIFQPGQSVSGNRAHQNWYNAPEVGQSVGGSGLKLRSDRDIVVDWIEPVTISGNVISGPTYPTGWDVGTEIAVRFTQDVIVGEASTNNEDYNTFQMDLDYLGVSVGALVDVKITGLSGSNFDPSDQMRIDSIDGNTYTLGVYQRGIWWRVRGISAGTGKIAAYRNGRSYVPRKITSINAARDEINVSGAGFPSSTSSGGVSFDQGVFDGGGVWSPPFAACPPGETTNRIEFDIFAPQGLGYVNDDGDVVRRSRTVEIRFRDIDGSGGSGWTTVSKNISGQTRDQLGWTWQVGLGPRMRPEVQVRRTTSEDNDTRAMDRLEWYGLRSQLPTKNSYDGITVMAVTVTGSDTIASQTENKVSLVATRKLPTLNSNGTWSAPQATRSIAAWVAHIATTAGYSYDDLDTDDLLRLDAKWSQRGDYFDFIEADESTVKESLNRCLRAGMSELTIDAGKLRPVRDEPRSTFEQMYTPQNMTQPLARSVEAPRPDDADGVDVEYIDSATWSKETVECRLPGDQGIKAEKVRVDGVTDKTRAWRIGMRRRRELKYRRWTYSFSTELDALNSRYMSYCALADDIPGYAQSALVEGVEVDSPDIHLLSSEPLEWQTGKSHVIAWRRPDGTLAGPFPAQPGDDERHVIAQMDEVPVIDYRREPPHLLFGTTDEWSFPVLITSINPRGFESVSVDAVGYDARVYEDDNNTPPS